ncbi:DUF4333 domain-containing protein [Geodermatophilus sp. DF01-2]|uniref:DUF4333 domain-containing protein n=1 Tax=Geodermatophilus sp. DF01-2 TaxID=2559610 RepID=UPI0010730CFD|nr:DUF4333 domain-containing protein [Geodermatophilus sp. DF01_2]TFV62443.1 DUF4333 domain-containing protein [Geodermatophilus sp. DF01_2]
MTNPPQGDQPGPYRPQQPWPQQSGPYGGQPPYGPPPPQYSQPWSGRPGAGQPTYGQPTYGQPWGGQPAHGQQLYGQPWGGQPPYGPPAPPRRSRTGLAAGIVVPAVLLVVAVVLARLLGDTVLDTGAVEDDVAEQFEQVEGVAVDLSCDDEMTVEQGADYECTGTTADGEEVTLRIVITDEVTASYTWEEV